MVARHFHFTKERFLFVFQNESKAVSQAIFGPFETAPMTDYETF